MLWCSLVTGRRNMSLVQQESMCHSPVPLLKVTPLQQILNICEHEAAPANSRTEDHDDFQVAASSHSFRMANWSPFCTLKYSNPVTCGRSSCRRRVLGECRRMCVPSHRFWSETPRCHVDTLQGSGTCLGLAAGPTLASAITVLACAAVEHATRVQSTYVLL